MLQTSRPFFVLKDKDQEIHVLLLCEALMKYRREFYEKMHEIDPESQSWTVIRRLACMVAPSGKFCIIASRFARQIWKEVSNGDELNVS